MSGQQSDTGNLLIQADGYYAEAIRKTCERRVTKEPEEYRAEVADDNLSMEPFTESSSSRRKKGRGPKGREGGRKDRRGRSVKSSRRKLEAPGGSVQVSSSSRVSFGEPATDAGDEGEEEDEEEDEEEGAKEDDNIEHAKNKFASRDIRFRLTVHGQGWTRADNTEGELYMEENNGSSRRVEETPEDESSRRVDQAGVREESGGQ